MRIVIPIVAALCSALTVPTQSQRQEPVFRSGAGTVAVYVTVSDAEGKLVPDLTRDDFEIYDNGKLQNLTLFESGVQPITIVLMLDRSGSMISNFRLVRSAAEQFVEQLLPGDKARIGSFSNRIQIDPKDFTSNKRDLIEILRTELQDAGPTPLWNAVNVAITALQHQDGRRVILMFTDGIDRADEQPQHQPERRHEERRGARHHGVHDRSPGSRATSPDGAGDAARASARWARQAGSVSLPSSRSPMPGCRASHWRPAAGTSN